MHKPIVQLCFQPPGKAVFVWKSGFCARFPTTKSDVEYNREWFVEKGEAEEMKKKMTREQANLLCLLTAAIWGGGFIATDVAIDTFEPFVFLMIRFVLAGLLAWIPLAFTRERITKETLKTGMISGFFLYTAFAFQTFGLAYSEPGMNAFLTSTNVVIVPYLAWMVYRKKSEGSTLLASFLCLAGIGFLSLSKGGFSFSIGDGLTLICALLFAAQIVSLQNADRCPVNALNAVQLSTAGVLSLFFGLKGPYPAHVSFEAIASMGYSVILATLVCYLLQTLAQQHTSAAAASVLLGTESLWANVFSFLLLGSRPSLMMILGGTLIFMAILIVEGKGLFEGKRKRPDCVQCRDES